MEPKVSFLSAICDCLFIINEFIIKATSDWNGRRKDERTDVKLERTGILTNHKWAIFFERIKISLLIYCTATDFSKYPKVPCLIYVFTHLLTYFFRYHGLSIEQGGSATRFYICIRYVHGSNLGRVTDCSQIFVTFLILFRRMTIW
jgi:hypothetical protein